MYHNKQAFTLIELLVVVLIIGILAAIAVPQYKKAVLKSRYTQAKTMGAALANAMEVYYLANGTYTPQLEELDVSLEYSKTSQTETGNTPCQETDVACYYHTNWGYCEIEQRGQIICRVKPQGTSSLAYLKFLSHSRAPGAVRQGNTFCRTEENTTSNDITYQICQAETGSQTPISTWPERPSFLYQ